MLLVTALPCHPCPPAEPHECPRAMSEKSLWVSAASCAKSHSGGPSSLSDLPPQPAPGSGSVHCPWPCTPGKDWADLPFSHQWPAVRSCGCCPDGCCPGTGCCGWVGWGRRPGQAFVVFCPVLVWGRIKLNQRRKTVGIVLHMADESFYDSDCWSLPHRDRKGSGGPSSAPYGHAPEPGLLLLITGKIIARKWGAGRQGGSL